MAEKMDLTSSTKLPAKTEYEASIKADEGYHPGRLNIESGILESDTTIYATNANSSIAHLVLKQYDHQYIQVTTYNRLGEKLKVYKKESVVPLKIGTMYSLDIVSDIGYTSSVLVNADNKKHNLYRNKFVYAKEDAKPKECVLYIPSQKNQTVNVYTRNGIFSTRESDNKIRLPYDSEFYLEIVPDYGYISGKLNLPTHTPLYMNLSNEEFVLSNLTCTIKNTRSAKVKQFKVTIPYSSKQEITLLVDNKEYTHKDSPVMVDYGSSYKVIIFTSHGYVPGRFYTTFDNYPAYKDENKIYDDVITIYHEISGTIYSNTEFHIADAVKIYSGILTINYLDQNKEKEPLTDWYTHYHELDDSKPQLGYYLDNPHKDEPLFTELALTPNESKTNYHHDDDDETEDWYYLNHLKKDNEITHCMVNIVQQTGQIIKVFYNGKTYTESFIVPINSSISASLQVIDENKYIKGKLNVTEGVSIKVTSNIVIEATKPLLRICRIFFKKYPNQRLYAIYKGEKYYDDFIVYLGESITIGIEAVGKEYTPGTPIPSGTIVVHKNMTIKATNAILKMCAIRVHNYHNQHFEITTSDGTVYKTDPSESIQKTFAVPYGTIITKIELIPDKYYVFPKSSPSSSLYHINGDFRKVKDDIVVEGQVEINSAQHSEQIFFTIKINPDSKSSQTIIVTYRDYKYVATYEKSYPDDVLEDNTVVIDMVEPESIIEIDLKPNSGYQKGELILDDNLIPMGGNKYKIMGSTVISNTPGKQKKYILTIDNSSGIGKPHINDTDPYLYIGYLIKPNEQLVRLDSSKPVTAVECDYGFTFKPELYISEGYSVDFTKDKDWYTIESESFKKEENGYIHLYSNMKIIYHDEKIHPISKKYKLSISQAEHQTIEVTYKGVKYTSGIIDVDYNGLIHVNIRADDGYYFGQPYLIGKYLDMGENIGQYAYQYRILSDCVIGVTDANKIKRKIEIHQTPHQLISVSYAGNEFTEGPVYAEDGANVRFNVRPDDGYIPGEIQYTGAYQKNSDGSYTVLGDMTVFAKEAVLRTYTITFSSKISPNQTIIVTYKGKEYSNKTDQSITVNHNDAIKIKLIEKEHYQNGKLQITGLFTKKFDDYLVLSNLIIGATASEREKYKVTVINNYTYQTVYVNYQGVLYPDEVYIPREDKFKVYIKPVGGYTAGLIKTDSNSARGEDGYYTIYGDTVVQAASDAVKSKYKIVITDKDTTDIKYRMTSTNTGKLLYDGSKVEYNDIIWLQVYCDKPGYEPVEPTVSGLQLLEKDESKRKYKYQVTKKTGRNVRITLGKANLLPGTFISIDQTPNQKIRVFDGREYHEFFFVIDHEMVLTVEITADPGYDHGIVTLGPCAGQPGTVKYVTPEKEFARNGGKIIPLTHVTISASKATHKTVDDTVSLRYYGQKNNPDNYDKMTTLPKEQLDYLRSGLKVNNLSNFMNGCQMLTSLPKLDNMDTSYTASMMQMFLNCKLLTSLDLSNLNTSNVDSMIAMFGGCESLQSLDLSNFNTSNVRDMMSMFAGCEYLQSLIISNFDTSNVIDMQSMFFGCKKIRSIDLSKFNTEKVTTMARMFENCSSLEYLDLSNFNTSNLSDTSNILYGCSNLKVLDMTNFNNSLALSKHLDGFGKMFEQLPSLEYLILNNKNLIFIPDIKDYYIPYPANYKILVPRESLEAYKNYPTWKSNALRFAAIEDYDIIKPGDGTIRVVGPKTPSNPPKPPITPGHDPHRP